MVLSRTLGAAVLSAALLLAFPGCGNDQNNIVVFSGQHPQLTTALVAAFEQQTGVTVSVRPGDSIVLAQQIAQAGANSEADVYMGENAPELTFLAERNLFARLPQSTLDQVPAADRSASGQWVGMAIRVSCLVYNPRALGAIALPNSVLDLAGSEWNGKVAVAPGDSDFVPLVSAVIAAHGSSAASDWLGGLKHNAAIYQDDEAVLNAVNSGTTAVGIINSYYWYRLNLEVGTSGMHSSLHYFPNGDVGSTENVAGVAILSSSKKGSNAQRFIDFVVSAQGQKILASGDDFEYTVNPLVAQNPALPKLSDLMPYSIDPARLGDDTAAAQLLAQAGLS